MLKWLFVSLSIITVYSNWQLASAYNLTGNYAYYQNSLNFYSDSLSGTAGFPYQYRILATWILSLLHGITGADVIAMDALLKVVLVFGCSLILYQHSLQFVEKRVAILGVLVFQGWIVLSLSQGFSVYYTNDYLYLFCLFLIVHCAENRQYWAIPLLCIVGCLARDVMLLTGIFLSLLWVYGDLPDRTIGFSVLGMIGVICFLKGAYPGNHVYWMLEENMRNWQGLIKVLVLFNLIGVLSIPTLRRGGGTVEFALGMMLFGHFLAILLIGSIREVRLFLPFSILVIPAGMQEFQKRLAGTEA